MKDSLASRPLRVALFSESYEPVRNGVSTSVRTLIDELRARRHHVVVLAPHYPDHVDDSPFVMRVPSLLTPINPGYPLPYPWFPRLRRELRRLSLDVLHSHTPWFLGMLAARIAHETGTPHISTYHTLYDRYLHYLFFMPPGASHTLLEWWLPEFYNQCARVIVPSRVAERSLRQYGVTTPIEVVPTGTPLPSSEHLTPASRAAVRDRFEVPQGAPLLLYVGRIAREKNVELVIDSFQAVARDLPQAHLLVVGSGPHLRACRRRAERTGVSARIRFAGAIPRSELDAIYAAADLFVFGSTTETQGLVVAEARAAGLPAVAADEGGAAESMARGEEGLAVPATTEAFAEAIRALLRNRHRLACMRAACLRNAPRFTPGAMAERVEHIYRLTAESGHASRAARAAR